jgi:hypothetical protein
MQNKYCKINSGLVLILSNLWNLPLRSNMSIGTRIICFKLKWFSKPHKISVLEWLTYKCMHTMKYFLKQKILLYTCGKWKHFDSSFVFQLGRLKYTTVNMTFFELPHAWTSVPSLLQRLNICKFSWSTSVSHDSIPTVKQM